MKISPVLFFCFFCGTAAFADMIVEQKLKSDLMPGQGQDSTMTMSIKGQKARIDLPASQMSSVIDLQGGKMYTLDHKQKQVMVMSLDNLKQAADFTSQSKSNQAKPTVKKTGKNEVINGYNCSEYEITGTGANAALIKCWITEDVNDTEMEPFRSFGGRMGGFLGLDGVQKPKGMVIRSESRMNIGGRDVTSLSEVRKIKKETVDPALFVLPPDYKVMEMPKFTPPPAQ